MFQYIIQGILLWAAMSLVAYAYTHDISLGGFMTLIGGLVLAILAMVISGR